MRTAPRLLGVTTAVPANAVRQGEVRQFAAALFSETIGLDPRLLQIFENAQINKRHLCMPLEWYAADHTFEEKNALYVEHALALSLAAAGEVLERAGLDPVQVDHLVFVSSTGFATPSMDARIINALRLRGDVRRTPVWGLGCAGGAVGVSRARDFALADPGAIVLMIALELCSLTFQRNDLTKRNLVAASLFADGAAAVLVAGIEARRVPGDGRMGLELLATQSTLWDDTLDVMGWTVDGDGLHVVFSSDIPTIVRDKARPALEAFLSAHQLTLADVDHMVLHPGGAKVLRAYGEALALDPGALDLATETLRDYGNMSSPSCLFVLDRHLATNRIAAGDLAVLAALGPGFSSEFVLMRGVSE